MKQHCNSNHMVLAEGSTLHVVAVGMSRGFIGGIINTTNTHFFYCFIYSGLFNLLFITLFLLF